ncbi:MAG: histone deacetylase family protein [Alphaproteobacteria bacterium]
MPTLLFTHSACLDHDNGPTHPERPDRLRAVLNALEGPAFAGLERREAPEAERTQLTRVHPDAYVDRVLEAVPTDGRVHLDPDTAVSPGSREAALRAAGAMCAAVDAVAAGEARNAFCAVRPPGHHAEPSRAMGFCLFNNVAIGAEQARTAHAFRRVAVVDFDVHHGNGTQAVFEKDRDLFYASAHQWPHYPGTGAADERGLGNVVNVPLAAMSGGRELRLAFIDHILPALEAFEPDFLLVSAGFDAHAADPLALLQLTEDDFAWATAELVKVAEKSCGRRVVSVLEGGYDLDALAASAAAHVRALMA